MKKEPIYIHKWLPGKIALVQLSISRDGGWYDKLSSDNDIKQYHIFSICKSKLNNGRNNGYRLVLGPLQLMIGW